MIKLVKKRSAQKRHVNLILLTVVLILAVIISVTTGKGSINSKPGLPGTVKSSVATKTYTNKSAGISLEYPEGWSIKENPAAGIIVAFGSPKESDGDKFVDNINVSTANLSSKPNVTLAQLTDTWIKQSEKTPSFKLLERKSTSLDGETATQLIYSITNDKGLSLKGMVVMTMKNKKAYLVTYTAENGSYKNFINDAEIVVSSFSF